MSEHEHAWQELGKCTHSGQTAVYEQTALGCACGAGAHRTDVFLCGVRRSKAEQAALPGIQARERDACPALAHVKAHRAATTKGEAMP